MPSTSSGRIVKSSKSKRGTPHQKNHRWESFTTKISKLNSLDPLRRVRRHDLDIEDLERTTSYLKSGLEKWQELCITGEFLEFCSEIGPLCDSLPQILHFEDKIMDILVRHLEKKERESTEALLSLLTDFAHDLGFRFQKYYARALGLVISIARTRHDVDILEWSFACLAFLFKYLSKLLVPDLRPTYDLIAPLLGKEKQPTHIARFAAEAMSFLVKKAAAPAVRDKALRTIVHHVNADLMSVRDTKSYVLYYHGVMTMFAEAAKGNGLTIHSTAPTIISALYLELDGEILKEGEKSSWQDVISGVLTSLVHHCSSETFAEIMQVVVDHATEAVKCYAEVQTANNFAAVAFSGKSIGIVSGVRKGSRISNWPAILNSLSQVMEAVSSNNTIPENNQDSLVWQSVVFSAGVVLQYAPMETIIPVVATYMTILSKEPLAKWFFLFCSYLATADGDRFSSLALPYFQRFVIAHWSDSHNENILCILIPKLVSSGALIGKTGGKDAFALPQSWQDQIVSKYERLEVSPFPENSPSAIGNKTPQGWREECLPKYSALLEVLECTTVHPSTNARIAEILLRKMKLALRPSSSLALDEAHFIVGRGFRAFNRMSKGSNVLDSSVEPLVLAASPRYSRLPTFLEALLVYETDLTGHNSRKTSSDQEVKKNFKWSISGDDGSELLVSSLVNNLATDSHQLRLVSLQLLDLFFTVHKGSSSDVLATMLLIEQMPLDLQTARSASMHIRKLASVYSNHTSDPVLTVAIPFFCFGMLTVKFAQVWDDASAAISQICESASGADIVAELAFRWLDTPSAVRDHPTGYIEPSTANCLTDFECSNLMKLKSLAADIDSDFKEPQTLILQKFISAQEVVLARPRAARAQSLRVLAKVPSIAERRSRQLTPMFLSWAKPAAADLSDDEHILATSDWTRQDQKGLLDLFCLFTNPKVLYKSSEVYSALLSLLENGDLEVQKSALKAIYTWKSLNVKPYEESLLNLLDEARFKDEITLLMQGQSNIQPEHRFELMPILLRLLYGRTISKKGAASGRQGMEGKRLVVLRNLSVNDVGSFLDIALGELRDVNILQEEPSGQKIIAREIISVRKQVGFVNMMEDVLKELGNEILPFTHKILSAVLYCLIFSNRQLQNNHVDEEEGSVGQNSMLKVVRQTGLKCLILLFTNDTQFDWSPFMAIIYDELISPRIENLPIETAQGVSGLLQLFSTWSSSPRLVRFLGHDQRILIKVAECLAPPKSKDSVKLFALAIIRKVTEITLSDDQIVNNFVREELLDKNIDTFLLRIGNILEGQQEISKDLLEACVETVSDLAPFVSKTTQARNLVDVSVFLLNQPSRRVNPKTKSDLLLILEHLVPLHDLQNETDLKDKVFNTVTSLFGFFRDRKSREVLCRVLSVYSRNDHVFGEVASICTDLNSFADGRLDEPDYDRRLKAFKDIKSRDRVPLTPDQWRPLLYNMIFYIRHDEEFGILSSNSSDGICSFLDIASVTSDAAQKDGFEVMLSSILLPALYAGVREPSELVRREYVNVMAHLVRSFPDRPDVSDMCVLLGGDDELEASFFNNVLAAGKGRQSGALGQLAKVASEGMLQSKTVSQFFIPLLEHFIFDRVEGSDGHNLAAEATTTLSILAASLEWGRYRALLRRFIGYVETKPELEKQIIKLIGKIIDTLAGSAEAKYSVQASRKGISETNHLQNGDSVSCALSLSTLAVSLPGRDKFVTDLTTNILPPLLEYLHDKDESTVSLRVPVAIIIVRLLKLLPQDKLVESLPAVLTDICHILRSKAQESRDMARDTLTKICVLLGPSCFGFVLKELRGALARGYQLHVLSYTMHSILVMVTPEYSPGDLDYCLPSIVSVIMDDIFGVTGQEKDAEEYVSKMKEVKSSKSQDSMELIAQTATLSRLTDLVQPIQILLRERLNLRIVRKIDELLNRISNGVLKNKAADSRDSLIFCYQIIQEVHNRDKAQPKTKEDYKLKRYLIQRGANKSGSRGSTTVYSHKLIRFAFDVLRSVLKKHENLRTGANLAGFVPIIGDVLVQSEEEIKSSAFRLLTTIAKVSLKESSDGANLYKVAVTEAIRSIQESSTTTSDAAQAALKLISVVLRDRKDITVKETSVDDLLTRLKEDMTDPEHRHVTFNFLRAVLDSKVESAIVYDTLDYVGTVMVTNSDKNTRDLARGAYFQFLREYPQKKNRWSKQLSFIVANLKYEREGGRLSILEVIHLLLSKSSHDFIQEVSATCFVPLIFVLVNDESEKCRMAAGQIIKEILKRADRERTQTFRGMMRSWMQQTSNPSVLRLAFQTYGFYFEVKAFEDASDVEDLQKSIFLALMSGRNSESDWELIYSALELASVLCEIFPEKMLASDASEIWKSVQNCLLYPHAWVKLSSARLLGIFYADIARQNAETGFENLPLKGSNGLELSAEDIRVLTRRTLAMLKTPELTELLANEIVKDLVFLGQCAATSDLKWKPDGDEESEDEDGEDADQEQDQRTALQYLFGRLSFLLRRETSPPRAPMLIPKTAALQLVQNLCGKLDVKILNSTLPIILLPLHNLTDPAIPTPYSTDDLFKTNYEALRSTSQDLMAMLQSKCGVAVYTAQLLKVREGVKERRSLRSRKRKIEAVAAPEKFGREKARKGERKKERRKEKGLEHREQRRSY